MDTKKVNVDVQDTVPESSRHVTIDESNYDSAAVAKISRVSQIMSILVSGIALFSDGYNAQITMSKSIKTRLTNSYLIGEIVGMLFLGFVIDKCGRRFGIVAATILLVLGIVLATAAHGSSDLGLFWMMIVARGIAGVGAGGEYPVCGTSAAEAADESPGVRARRGFWW